MTASATLARLAIWDAVNNWPDLNPGGTSVFRRKLTHDDDPALIPSNQSIGIGDLPAIDISPLAENPAWETHRMQHVPYAITVTIYHTKLAALEDLVEKTVKAIWQAKDNAAAAGMSYVRTATGQLPVSTQATYVRDKASKDKPGSPVSWAAAISVLLKFNRDPLGDT